MSSFPLLRTDERIAVDVMTDSPTADTSVPLDERSEATWRWEGQRSVEENDSAAVKKLLSQEAEELDTLEKELAEKIYNVQVEEVILRQRLELLFALRKQRQQISKN